MSLAVDETAGDLPVRDVGLMRGGLMPTIPDTVRDGRSWKKSQVLKLKDRQRVLRIPREQLEDQCLRLQEENNVLRRHTHAQEHRLRRMSTKLMRVRQGRPSTAGLREADLEDTIQELEVRVATLESQKGVLQSKLSMARQHILDLGGRAGTHRLSRGRGLDGEGGVRRAAQTAPPYYRGTSNMEDSRGEMERFRSSVMDNQARVGELEMTAQTLKDSLREKDREMENSAKDLRRQQADTHRMTIKDNVESIRLQKQLSEKNAALRVIQEKFNLMQETFESQLEQRQQSLKDSQGALLEKAEDLNQQLKQERQRALQLEAQLSTATLSLHALEEFQERVSDLEGEKSLLKESYDTLLESTLSSHGHQEPMQDKEREWEKKRKRENNREGEQEIKRDHEREMARERQRDRDREREKHREREEERDRERDKDGDLEKGEEVGRSEFWRLKELLRAATEERDRLEEEKREAWADRERLEEEKETLRREKESIEEQRLRERELTASVRENQDKLKQEVMQYKDQVTSQQAKLDSITQEFDMSVEDLSETLLQIKAFRMQLESQDSLCFLGLDGKGEEPVQELADLRASLSETVLELHKTRDLLLLQHRISSDLQAELNTMMERSEREKEESRRREAKKDKLLDKKALQIDTLRVQMKEVAYGPRNHNQAIPLQYTWPGDNPEVVRPIEEDIMLPLLRPGETLLEVHLKVATFTPSGLRAMAGDREGSEGVTEVVTFCTYALLDFEMHATPLVPGTQPEYGFTSRYPLSARDLGRLGGQGGTLRVELHQSLGGIRFVTRGRAEASLVGTVERRGERVSGRANVKGLNGEIIGVLDYWSHLSSTVESMDTVLEMGVTGLMDKQRAPTYPNQDRQTAAPRRPPAQPTLGWQDSLSERELFDYGGGIPNELEVVLERCVGLSARWPPGLLPDAYLTYRLYDLPAHSTATVPCSADPLFNDSTRYPLAVTTDVLEYLNTANLWVYVYNDNDGGNSQPPPSYLAKTPIPLLLLASGKQIRGDYVLRDTGGSPRGVVRVAIRWCYPFQPPESSNKRREVERMDIVMDREEMDKKEERTKELQRPIAKPRVKLEPRPPPTQLRRGKGTSSECASNASAPEPSRALPLQSPARKRTTSSRHARMVMHSVSDDTTLDVPSLELVSMDEEDDEGKKAQMDSENLDSSESGISSHSDVIVIPQQPKRVNRGEKMTVEILSLTLETSSKLARDQSVQRVFVEYRLLGVPMETTETPMSLRTPRDGEHIHYNFTRVIYVNSSEAGPLRQYLYTMLEGTDPNQGRLKFTVVSEPMDQAEDCVDVGHAFLDLKELLLTGNDIIERDIDIVSVAEDNERLGKLKVSLEAAKVLNGIFSEFHGQEKKDEETGSEDDESGENEDEEEEEGQDATIKKEDTGEDEKQEEIMKKEETEWSEGEEDGGEQDTSRKSEMEDDDDDKDDDEDEPDASRKRETEDEDDDEPDMSRKGETENDEEDEASTKKGETEGDDEEAEERGTIRKGDLTKMESETESERHSDF